MYVSFGTIKVIFQNCWVYVVNYGTGTGTENRFLTHFGTVEPVPEEWRFPNHTSLTVPSNFFWFDLWMPFLDHKSTIHV